MHVVPAGPFDQHQQVLIAEIIRAIEAALERGEAPERIRGREQLDARICVPAASPGVLQLALPDLDTDDTGA